MEHILKQVFLLVSFFGLIISTTDMIYLKENEIINGNFAFPRLGGQSHSYFDYSIPGWTCKRIC